ncbi:asparaginase domain-containing protein [Apibacter mensalis]|uniref:asparaginase domain-containing protein n=1 Tax=Apibacter mensalis TaxID=1586267 RepID=UPI00093F2FD3
MKKTLIYFKKIYYSDIYISNLNNLGNIILNSYSKYDGFALLPGTDAMSTTASIMSFKLQGLLNF